MRRCILFIQHVRYGRSRHSLIPYLFLYSVNSIYFHVLTRNVSLRCHRPMTVEVVCANAHIARFTSSFHFQYSSSSITCM